MRFYVFKNYKTTNISIYIYFTTSVVNVKVTYKYISLNKANNLIFVKK